jgi:hypothetical protein
MNLRGMLTKAVIENRLGGRLLGFAGGEKSRVRALLLVTVGVLALLVAGQSAHAQLQVQFTPAKKVFLAHEAVSGVLRLTNNAGRDIVLGGESKERSWLDFQITGPRGHLVPMRRSAVKQEPIVLRNNEPYEVQVIMNRNYDMGETGLYRVKPNVYFPPLDRYFSVAPMNIQITDGKAFFVQAFGVPVGREGAGTYREYELINFAQRRGKQLYFRLKDKDSGFVRQTYSLGLLLMVQAPRYAVDGKNRLHVLHMAAPQAYAHVVIDVDGALLTRDIYYEKDGNRPALVRIGQSDLGVQGGITADEHSTPYEERQFRKLSELPPGMPMLPVP